MAMAKSFGPALRKALRDLLGPEARGMTPMVGGTPEALARAREQGFDVDTPLYHGTNKDFPAFDLSKRGSGIGSRGEKAVFFTENPRDADLYGGNLFRNIGEPPPEGLATIPAYARGRIKELGPDDLGGRTRFDVHDFNLKKEIEKAKREGYDGLRINGMIERNFNAMGRQTAIFDPKNIRSRFAAFDPAKKDSSDLLAGLAAGIISLPMLRAALAERRERRA